MEVAPINVLPARLRDASASSEARLSLACCHVRIPATKTSSFILALGSPAALEKDGALPPSIPPGRSHMGRDPGSPTPRCWSHGCPKPYPKLPGSPQLQKGLFHSTALVLAPRTRHSLFLQRTNTQEHQGCLYPFPVQRQEQPESPRQAQVKAPGEPPWWLLVLGNFGRINKRRARRGAEHCRLLLRAFNEVSMFHFRDKRALCHTGGAEMGEIRNRELHRSLRPAREHHVNTMPI